MTKTIKKGADLVKKTNGYKTTTSAVLFILIQLFGDKIPFLSENQEIIEKVIERLMELGILHKLWKSRKDLWEYIKDVYDKVINKFKKD